jgi:hypothetical protein
MSDDPVAWRVIERGWTVRDAAGNEIGKVDQITGDVEADIFDGITVGAGGTVLTRPRYVPSEHVTSIRRGEITLDLSPEDVAKLEPYREPVSKPLAALQPEPEQSTGRSSSGMTGLIERLFGRRP